jgi:hypothetical protein
MTARPVALIEPAGKFGELIGRRRELFGEQRAAERVDVGLLGEIKVCLEMSRSSRRSRRIKIGPDRPPPSCCKAASSCAWLRASMMPATASARVRSIRPQRNARNVNSPGSACRAPRLKQPASTKLTSGGDP